jgi:hypothetical protein
VLLAARAARGAASAVGAAVNPVSDRNLAYRGVNAVGGAVSGEDSWSLGAWLGELVHGDKDREAVQGPVGPYGSNKR